MKMTRPVALIIRDGWGASDGLNGNAVHAANTPNDDRYLKQCPHTLLDCSGQPVGLPGGYQGSSEVGHLNMGAGRVVVQELTRIDEALRTGALFEHAMWGRIVEAWKTGGGALHLLGLIQDEGVHAHQEHLFMLLRRARKEHPEGAIVVHAFLDGRDTPPRSSKQYMGALGEVLDEIGGRVGTVMGRYYAMDRSGSWELTDTAFRCMVDAAGRAVESVAAATLDAYANDKTPDGVEMCDEYVPPCVVAGYTGMQDGDVVVHSNYRQDRAIQLARAFVDADYPGSLARVPKLFFVGLTRYYNEFENYLLPTMDSGGGMDNLLGEVIAKAGFRQLRIAETQKFRHVTSFFNGKSTDPYDGEDQVEVPSRFDPATFATHPEMDAYNVTDELLKRLAENPYTFIAVNYANGDMVGHTGDFDAAKQAAEVVDACVGKVVERLLELDAHILVTADHGNAEEMVDAKGEPKTSHTLNPVDIIYVARDGAGRRLIERGKLADIAPTILYLLGLDIPSEMTAQNLFADA
jgi:2,3-bisphosphoglycerate-independent phosphoglycerate mutase